VTVARTSILTIPPEHLDRAAARMAGAEVELRGIHELPGMIAFFAGVDRSTSQLVNISFWESDDAARQMTTFQPMLDLASEFAGFDATFLRPVPNFELLWQWGDLEPFGQP
jgi:hypothetical protein